MNTPQNIYWQRTKMVLKFLWRHLLTIPSASLLILGICAWNTEIIAPMAFWTLVAIALDEGKCNRDSWRTPRERSNFDGDHHYRDQFNPCRMGTPAYFIDQAGKRY